MGLAGQLRKGPQEVVKARVREKAPQGRGVPQGGGRRRGGVRRSRWRRWIDCGGLFTRPSLIDLNDDKK